MRPVYLFVWTRYYATEDLCCLKSFQIFRLRNKGFSICSFGSWLFRRFCMKADHVLLLICDNVKTFKIVFSHPLFLEAFFLSFQICCQVESILTLPNRLSSFCYLPQLWFQMFEYGFVFLWTATSCRTHTLAKSESSLSYFRYLFKHRVNVNDFHSPMCVPSFWLVFMWPMRQIMSGPR